MFQLCIFYVSLNQLRHILLLFLQFWPPNLSGSILYDRAELFLFLSAEEVFLCGYIAKVAVYSLLTTSIHVSSYW